MKTKKLVFFSLMCLVSIMTSCGGDDVENTETTNKNETPDTTTSQTEKRYGGLGVMLSRAPGKWIAPVATNNAALSYSFGSTVHSFVRQNGKTYDTGTAFVKQNDDFSGSIKMYSIFGIELPKVIENDWYNVLVISNSDDAKLTDGKVVCSGNLKRLAGNDNSPCIFALGSDLFNTGPVIMGELAQVYEVLYLENKSDKEIIVRHKGFDAASRWYYTEATICPEEKSLISGTVSNEVVSDTLHIEPGGRKYFTSSYTPTGAKFTDVQFIAEIDGKEVRSANRASADTKIEVGTCYFMYCYWDGKELTFRELD